MLVAIDKRREAHTLQYYSLKLLDAERVMAEQTHINYSSVINRLQNTLHITVIRITGLHHPSQNITFQSKAKLNMRVLRKYMMFKTYSKDSPLMSSLTCVKNHISV